MTHVHTESPTDSSAAGSLLGDFTRFAVLVLLTLTLVVGTLIGLGGRSEAASTSPTAPTVAAASTSTKSVLRNAVVHLTNVQRVAHGCRALRYNNTLQRAAQGHANDMSRKHYFAHNSINGTVWWKRIMKAGYRDPGGENIARGFSSASSVVRAWLNSPEHRRNIMNCQFRTIGIGFNTHGDYWVQDFGY
jgi:uncharacterized protein YkwD